ncbi:hypothetical protein PR048_018176 [Dryococelus australis]|uniref:C2H2-type domain-containing protein n=1 Tax=Dryococelus australis TaxID=614101 RepID=A0ABQ9HBN7_9NEOP|nr:hypothetical protein PR048_018176 [Dryococelus australis]
MCTKSLCRACSSLSKLGPWSRRDDARDGGATIAMKKNFVTGSARTGIRNTTINNLTIIEDKGSHEESLYNKGCSSFHMCTHTTIKNTRKLFKILPSVEVSVGKETTHSPPLAIGIARLPSTKRRAVVAKQALCTNEELKLSAQKKRHFKGIPAAGSFVHEFATRLQIASDSQENRFFIGGGRDYFRTYTAVGFYAHFITPELQGFTHWFSLLLCGALRGVVVTLIASLLVRFPTGSLPDFRTWESSRTMPLVDVSPALAFRRCSILTSLHPRGSQDFDTTQDAGRILLRKAKKKSLDAAIAERMGVEGPQLVPPSADVKGLALREGGGMADSPGFRHNKEVRGRIVQGLNYYRAPVAPHTGTNRARFGFREKRTAGRGINETNLHHVKGRGLKECGGEVGGIRNVSIFRNTPGRKLRCGPQRPATRRAGRQRENYVPKTAIKSTMRKYTTIRSSASRRTYSFHLPPFNRIETYNERLLKCEKRRAKNGDYEIRMYRIECSARTAKETDCFASGATAEGMLSMEYSVDALACWQLGKVSTCVLATVNTSSIVSLYETTSIAIFVKTQLETTLPEFRYTYSCQSLVFRLLERFRINVHVLEPKTVEGNSALWCQGQSHLHPIWLSKWLTAPGGSLVFGYSRANGSCGSAIDFFGSGISSAIDFFKHGADSIIDLFEYSHVQRLHRDPSQQCPDFDACTKGLCLLARTDKLDQHSKICKGHVPPPVKQKDVFSPPQTCDRLTSIALCNYDVNMSSLPCTVCDDAIILPSVSGDVYVDGMGNSLSLSGSSCRYCGTTYSKSCHARRHQNSCKCPKKTEWAYLTVSFSKCSRRFMCYGVKNIPDNARLEIHNLKRKQCYESYNNHAKQCKCHARKPFHILWKSNANRFILKQLHFEAWTRRERRNENEGFGLDTRFGKSSDMLRRKNHVSKYYPKKVYRNILPASNDDKEVIAWVVKVLAAENSYNFFSFLFRFDLQRITAKAEVQKELFVLSSPLILLRRDEATWGLYLPRDHAEDYFSASLPPLFAVSLEEQRGKMRRKHICWLQINERPTSAFRLVFADKMASRSRLCLTREEVEGRGKLHSTQRSSFWKSKRTNSEDACIRCGSLRGGQGGMKQKCSKITLEQLRRRSHCAFENINLRCKPIDEVFSDGEQAPVKLEVTASVLYDFHNGGKSKRKIPTYMHHCISTECRHRGRDKLRHIGTRLVSFSGVKDITCTETSITILRIGTDTYFLHKDTARREMKERTVQGVSGEQSKRMLEDAARVALKGIRYVVAARGNQYLGAGGEKLPIVGGLNGGYLFRGGGFMETANRSEDRWPRWGVFLQVFDEWDCRPRRLPEHILRSHSEVIVEQRENKGEGKPEIPEKSHRPAASSGTIPTCENSWARPPEIEPCSPRGRRQLDITANQWFSTDSSLECNFNFILIFLRIPVHTGIVGAYECTRATTGRGKKGKDDPDMCITFIISSTGTEYSSTVKKGCDAKCIEPGISFESGRWPVSRELTVMTSNFLLCQPARGIDSSTPWHSVVADASHETGAQSTASNNMQPGIQATNTGATGEEMVKFSDHSSCSSGDEHHIALVHFRCVCVRNVSGVATLSSTVSLVHTPSLSPPVPTPQQQNIHLLYGLCNAVSQFTRCMSVTLGLQSHREGNVECCVGFTAVSNLLSDENTIMQTDHQALTSLKTDKIFSNRLTKWALQVQEFNL